MQDVDTGNAAQAELAKQALEAIILGPPTTIPPIPTRTADPNAEVIETTAQDVATSASTTAVTKPEGDQCIKQDSQLFSELTPLAKRQRGPAQDKGNYHVGKLSSLCGRGRGLGWGPGPGGR